jgi:hypothetical protein
MQSEDSRVATMQSAIKASDLKFERGEGLAYKCDKLVDIIKDAIQSLHSGEPIGPDDHLSRATPERLAATPHKGSAGLGAGWQPVSWDHRQVIRTG